MTSLTRWAMDATASLPSIVSICRRAGVVTIYSRAWAAAKPFTTCDGVVFDLSTPPHGVGPFGSKTTLAGVATGCAEVDTADIEVLINASTGNRARRPR